MYVTARSRLSEARDDLSVQVKAEPDDDGGPWTTVSYRRRARSHSPPSMDDRGSGRAANGRKSNENLQAEAEHTKREPLKAALHERRGNGVSSVWRQRAVRVRQSWRLYSDPNSPQTTYDCCTDSDMGLIAYYTYGLPSFLVVVIALYLLFTGKNMCSSSLDN